MNHSKDNWADPWAFRPDRFLAESKDASQSGNKIETLQAFSIGPRNCIGRKYENPSPERFLFHCLLTRDELCSLAYAEMRLILARIIFHFDLKLADSTRWIERQREFGLWDRIPLNVYLTPAKRNSTL